MPKNVAVESLYKSYLRGDTWRCPRSPTHAHHWRSDSTDRTLLRCIYCRARRRVPVERVLMSYPHYVIDGEEKLTIRRKRRPTT